MIGPRMSICAASSLGIFAVYKQQKSVTGTPFITYRNVANKSALSYIACYAKAGANYVYLQRGYRNYGVPQVLSL